MITCYRYSKNGFQSQFQEHLAGAIASFKELQSTLDNYNFNEHQRNLLKSALTDKNIDDDFKIHGVFTFLKKPTKKEFNHYLNHLDKKDRPDFISDLNIKDFADDTVCYIDDGFCFCKENKTTLKEAKENKHLAVFIPC
tara:strand:+ start:9859 stop:10275 length:417 start_codon:yes stop_codon:yes gene_type:complete